MPVTEQIGRIIMSGGGAMDVNDQAVKDGVWNLRRSGLEKVRNGATSLEEGKQRYHRIECDSEDSNMAVAATAGKKETQFIWEGKDKRGNKVRGKALAANENALRADLRRQGVAATRVKTQKRMGGGKPLPIDIAVFARQLATMMSAGIPMVQAFEIIGNGHEKALDAEIGA